MIKMKKFKKSLAMLTALTMAISIISIAPAMAEEGEEPALTPMEQLWYDTNLVINGDFENLTTIETNGYLENNPSGVGYWFRRDGNVYLSEKQAYSGEKAIYLEMPKGTSMSIFSPRVYNYNNELRVNTTYLSSYKIMGTTANRGYTVGEPLSTLFYDQTDLRWSKDDYLKFTSPTLSIAADDFAVAPALNDEGQTKLPQSAWKDITTAVTINNTAPENIGFGPFLNNKGNNTVAFYLDDYYFGELIVAGVENTTEQSEVMIPIENENTELELSAKAYNQLGTEEGLEECTYTWEIADENKDGVSIENGKLIVTNSANVRTVNLKVTCVPTFKGADAQSDVLKERRTINVSIGLVASPEASDAPQARETTLTGLVKDGETLTLGYKYWQLFNVPEGETEITWYRCESSTDEGTPFNRGELTYLLEDGDDEYFYRVEVKPVSEDGVSGNIEKTSVLCKATAPVASNVNVSGLQAIDEEWEVISYDYYDKNNDPKDEPLYQWFVSPTEKVEDGEIIEGATERTYKITEADAGKYVYAGVKAVSKIAPEVSEEFAYSQPRLTASTPKVTGVMIEKKTSNIVMVKYNYSHPFGVGEKESKIEWYVGSNLVGTGTSLNISSFNGETIEVRVTPMAEKKPYQGETVTDDYKVSFSTSTVGGSGGSGGSFSGGSSVKPITPVKPEIKNVPSWAKNEIEFVLSNKVMELAGENDFAGESKINRGEFMMSMLKAAGIEPTDYRGSFADVTSLDKFSGYLQSAFDNGIISPADNFYPARELTRDEMCKIIVTSIEVMTKKQISKTDITYFTDYSNIQEWAIDFISQAVATGIIKGNADGSVNPKGNVTRAEAAVVANRIFDYIKAEGVLKQ